MTCKGCVSSVTDKLISLDEVKDVKIDLASGNVVLEVSKTLTLEKLTTVLLPKYIPLYMGVLDCGFPSPHDTCN